MSRRSVSVSPGATLGRQPTALPQAPLFQKQMVVHVLSSGSAGNCTYVGDGRSGVLIDCGISARQVKLRMEAAGLGQAPLQAVLITHEHRDHVGAAAILSRELRRSGRPVPFFMTKGTWEGSNPQCRPDGAEFIEAGVSFTHRGIGLDPIPVPHDARDPVAWRVRFGNATVAVITDLGRPTSLVAREMRECDALVLEFNHDEEMLLEGPYPLPLKQRIRGNHGHLSNRQAAELLRDGLGPRLQHLLLAHLSEENNRPELARQTAEVLLREAGANVPVGVTRQREAIAPIHFQASAF